MTKGLPSENLLAEPLRGTRQFVDARGSRKTYPANPFDVARRRYLQNLQCDRPTMVLNRPHVRVPAAMLWGLCSIVMERNDELFWEQGSTPTNLVQGAHAPPADLGCEAINMLVDGAHDFSGSQR